MNAAEIQDLLVRSWLSEEPEEAAGELDDHITQAWRARDRDFFHALLEAFDSEDHLFDLRYPECARLRQARRNLGPKAGWPEVLRAAGLEHYSKRQLIRFRQAAGLDGRPGRRRKKVT